MRPALDPGFLRTVYDRAAHRYDRWHALATARTDQRGRRLLVDRCVKQGDLVLDAGGGTGLSTVLAAHAVGPTGSVAVIDLSPGMLQRAEERIAAEGYGDRVSLRIGDILHMPYPDGLFDVVLSTYSVCPLADPAGGVEEMWRVLKPGGLLGVAHSSEPNHPVMRWFADRVEDIVWRWPQLSLGCRSVSVLPRLLDLGGAVAFERKIGIPLWPFRVIVVKKPALTQNAS
jgi:ubiquinone/menaquinone biosynthesis C-methylase UbiE